jgi:outer membrane protein OmpA-like peptidoglycan-associated protein
MKKPWLLFLLFVLAENNFAQLKIDTSFSPEMLVDSFLVGEGVRVGNIKITGHKRAMGLYSADSNAIGIKKGILLSTGLSTDAIGPNNTPGKSGVISMTSKGKLKGDKDLNKVARGKTYDVLVIEFDFVATHNKFSFNYSFGSEEYTEYVGSSFNDVFAFFINGNGYRNKNIALLPDHRTAVTINNVNHKKNKKYFLTNDYFNNTGLFKTAGKPYISKWKLFWTALFGKGNTNGSGEVVFYTKEGAKKDLDQYVLNNFQYDGFTKKLSVECKLIPYKKYHLKIAIGDVGDAVFDSGVFLEGKSLKSTRDTTITGYVPYIDRGPTFNFDSVLGHYHPPIHIAEDTTSAEHEEQFEMPVIYFSSASSAIPDSAMKKLDKVAGFLTKNAAYKIEIFGYTDNTGKAADNEKLSQERAHAVMDYLVKKGANRTKLSYIGHSSENPVGDNTTEEGKLLNRRVELELVKDGN